MYIQYLFTQRKKDNKIVGYNYLEVNITSKYHDLIVYDHQEVILTNYDGFGIREKRAGYTKILQ